jgi:glutamyl-Q tRNA(Asp) synthetase
MLSFAPSSSAVFRFAPSPNGPLHLGHARSALINQHLARKLGGRLLLRIEDIDKGRTREDHVNSILDDLAWLGLAWEKPVLRQSTRFAAYAEALGQLEHKGALYPCFCSRSDVAAAVHAKETKTGMVVARDPDGVALYPGTCRSLSASERCHRRTAEPFCLRLDSGQISAQWDTMHWQLWDPLNNSVTPVLAQPAIWGDAVIGRKDIHTSYHLAVVLDDAFERVTHVVRGKDLEQATHLHRLLQALLALPVPCYHHHDLVLGPDGRKLSKSEGSEGLQVLRARGVSAETVRQLVFSP